MTAAIFRACIIIVVIIISVVVIIIRGGDLGGLGGRSPKNLRWGDGLCIRLPNIWRSIVLSDARESMNRVKKSVYLVRRWSYTTFNIVKSGKRKRKSEKPGR